MAPLGTLLYELIRAKAGRLRGVAAQCAAKFHHGMASGALVAGARVRTERALVGSGIDAARQTACHYETAIGQSPCHRLCHLIPVRGQTTRGNEGN